MVSVQRKHSGLFEQKKTTASRLFPEQRSICPCGSSPMVTQIADDQILLPTSPEKATLMTGVSTVPSPKVNPCMVAFRPKQQVTLRSIANFNPKVRITIPFHHIPSHHYFVRARLPDAGSLSRTTVDRPRQEAFCFACSRALYCTR